MEKVAEMSVLLVVKKKRRSVIVAQHRCANRNVAVSFVFAGKEDFLSCSLRPSKGVRLCIS